MAVRMMVCVAALICMLVVDWPFYTKRMKKKELFIYTVLVGLIVYMGIDYTANYRWFDYYDTITLLFGQAAKQLEAVLTNPPS